MALIRHILRNAAALIGAIVLLAAPGTALAANRALLIGVGNFANLPDAHLPGIDLDVETAAGIAQRLGFGKVIRLEDGAATRKAILAALEDALVTGADRGDRVLIYLSSHGTLVNVDHAGGDALVESAVLANDARRTADAEGHKTLHGVIIADDFAAVFRRARVRSITLLVDACQSGSIYRDVELGRSMSGTSHAVKKFYVWDGMPTAATVAPLAKAFLPKATDGAPAIDVVAIAAAGDHESALATPSGSMFTVGVRKTIDDRSAEGRVSPRQMLEGASRFIAANADDSAVFHPELHGTGADFDTAWALSNTAAGGGPNWQAVAHVVTGLPALPIEGVAGEYRDGQRLALSVKVPQAGYLNVVAVGPDDTITLLFPNQFIADNHVEAGTIALPAAIPPMPNGRRVFFPVTAPYGRTMVAAILTTEKVDLFQSAVDSNDGKALRTPSLAGLKAAERAGMATRAFGVTTEDAPANPQATAQGPTPAPVPPQVTAWAASVEAQTCAAGGC